MKTADIWTIGHSTREIGEFISLLQSREIEAVADVRLLPGSRRYPQFNREQLEATLVEIGIEYVHFPELGGRRRPLKNSPNDTWRNESFRGYADYMMTEPFNAGIERLLQWAERKRTVILCAEALWWRCHRALIADELKVQGKVVRHILSKPKAEEHPFTAAARIVAGKLSYRATESPAELNFD